MKSYIGSLLLFTLFLTSLANAQTAADPALLAEINRIRAVDNHAHVMAVSGADGKEDEEYDAVACGKLEFVSPPPLRLRINNPIYTGAWRALYGYKHGDITRERASELARMVMRENAVKLYGLSH